MTRLLSVMFVTIGLVLLASTAQAQGSVAASYGHNASLTAAGTMGSVKGMDLDLYVDITPDLDTEAGEQAATVSAGVRVGKRFSDLFGAGVGVGLGNTIDGRVAAGFGEDSIDVWDMIIQPYGKVFLDQNSGVILRGAYRALSEGLTRDFALSVGIFTGW